MPDGTHGAALLRAGRQDRATARVIYQAQALRRAFGRRVAHTFLVARRLPAALVTRVLDTTDQHLRR